MTRISDEFIRSTVSRFRTEDLPRLKKALDTLPEEDLWWRPHDHANSVGNLLVHLNGNIRQWIISGIGGEPDQRNRAQEFIVRDGYTKTELFDRLAATVETACQVIEKLDEETLLRTYSIQGRHPTGLEAVYHVLEHFGFHLGQIVWIVKMRAGADHGLAFYNDAELNQRKNNP